MINYYYVLCYIAVFSLSGILLAGRLLAALWNAGGRAMGRVLAKSHAVVKVSALEVGAPVKNGE